MTMHWNNEYITAMEHRDFQANAMAVNNTGNYVLLAGRKYIAIRNLDNNNEGIRKFPMQSKYDVGSAEWNPTTNHSELCVISSNQRLEVFTWSLGELTLTNSLKAHTRVITDLNWHRTDTNMLASCSVDTFIHIWDLRDPRRPASSLSAIAEASQVRWNPLNGNVLATAHDGDLKLWDQRKGSAPVQYVAAHLAKIHGLDWNPTNEHQLATCSQDNTVKFFDTENPRRAEFVLTTSAPVWRARFTPFGNGLVTVVVPQLRRGENSLLLWNTENRSSPVHTFVGHKDVVLEFAWRHHDQGDPDYQLVTWSKDQSLLVWRIEPYLLTRCGYQRPDYDDDHDLVINHRHHHGGMVDLDDSANHQAVEDDEEGHDEQDSYDIGPDWRSGQGATTTAVILQQEFDLVNATMVAGGGDGTVLWMDVEKRSCLVRGRSASGVVVTVQVNFPNSYPHGVPPSFKLVDDGSIDTTIGGQILRSLAHVAHQRVQKNRTCLQICLRQLVVTLDQLSVDTVTSKLNHVNNSLNTMNLENTDISATTNGTLLPTSTPIPTTRPRGRPSPSPSHSLSRYSTSEPTTTTSTHLTTTYSDGHVPFPRTSGAKFCSANVLVVFGRPVVLTRVRGGGKGVVGPPVEQQVQVQVQQQPQRETPRALSAVLVGGGSVKRGGVGDVSVTSWYYNRQRLKGGIGKELKAVVLVYNTADLHPVHRTLGARYVLDGDVATICRWNADVAREVGREDLVQAWRLAELVAGPQPAEEEEDCQWTARHPFGTSLIHSLITHYARQSDIQMAAMLSCIFGKEHDTATLRKSSLKGLLSPTQVAPGRRWLKGGGSPYHTIPPADIVTDGWVIPALLRSARSSSLDNLRLEEPVMGTLTPPSPTPPANQRLSATSALYEYYKRAYAETLHRWNLLYNRAEVLKYLSGSTASDLQHHRGVQFLTDCQYCVKPSQGCACVHCRRLALNCVICHVSVRGSANCCLYCGHGGHTLHMQHWFRSYDTCPTGCGCRCLENTAGMLDT